jgi:hypothetical protein
LKQETERAVLAAGVPADRVLQVLGSMEDDTTAPKIVAATLEKFGRQISLRPANQLWVDVMMRE